MFAHLERLHCLGFALLLLHLPEMQGTGLSLLALDFLVVFEGGQRYTIGSSGEKLGRTRHYHVTVTLDVVGSENGSPLPQLRCKL